MFGILFDKLQSIKMNYLKKTPREKWLFVRNAGIIVLRTTGVPVLDPNFKVYWFSCAAGAVILDVTLPFIYSVWYFTGNGNDPTRAMLNIPLYFGVLLPSAISYLMVMIDKKREMYQSLAFFGGDKIYTNVDRQSNPSYIRACDQCAIELLKQTIVTLGIVIGSINVYLGFPMYSYTFKHELQLPVPVLLPFTDDETSRGLFLNFLNQIFVAVIGLNGNIGIEIITCILKNNMLAATTAIRHSVDEFSELMRTSKRAVDVNYYLRNILAQVQDFDRYVLQLSDFYYWRFFLQPILCNISVALALFFYFFIGWTAGLGAAFLTYSQMYILCDIGNEVDTASDQLLYIFNTMPWYLLSRHKQLTYGHLLNRLQNGAVLQVGPFSVLNFATFSEMTKRIYTVLTMLTNTMT